MHAPSIAIGVLVLLLTASNGGREHRLVCEDVLHDGSLARMNCDQVVSAVLAELDPGQAVDVAVVWSFIGCPPAAYCGLNPDPSPKPPPTSALVGVRLADSSESVWIVGDAETAELVSGPFGGYDPDWLIDGLLNSVAATREP